LFDLLFWLPALILVSFNHVSVAVAMAPTIVSLLRNFGYSLSVPIHCRFLSTSYLLPIFNYSWRFDARTLATHSTAWKRRTREASTETTHVSKTPIKEIIIIEESSAKAAEWVISLLPLSIVRVVLLLTLTEVSEKIVIVVSEETLKRISPSECSPEQFISLSITEARSHIKVRVTSSKALEISLLWCCWWVKSLFAVFVENWTFIFIWQDWISLANFLKNFFCFFGVVRILVRMPLHCELSIGLLDFIFVRISADAQNHVIVVRIKLILWFTGCFLLSLATLH